MVERFTPTARIEIDGEDKTRPIWEHLESFSYEDVESGEADNFEISVANSPAFAIPHHGAKVKIWMGYRETGLQFMGTFEVDETTIELRPAIMRIRGKSAGFSKGTAKQKRDVQWENTSLKELAQKIGTKHGYKAKVDVDVHYPAIAQTQESDLHFLQRLSDSVGANFALRDNTILITKPNQSSRKKISIVYSSSVSGSFTLKDREKYGKVKASWWDLKEGAEKSVEAETGDEAEAVQHIKKRFSSMSEAKTAADIKASRLHRNNVEGQLALPGDAGLTAGAEATLEGFEPSEINGTYIITKSSHSMTKNGWTTQISLGDGEKSARENRKPQQKGKKASFDSLKEK